MICQYMSRVNSYPYPWYLVVPNCTAVIVKEGKDVQRQRTRRKIDFETDYLDRFVYLFMYDLHNWRRIRKCKE